jgi:uncharacterized protein
MKTKHIFFLGMAILINSFVFSIPSKPETFRGFFDSTNLLSSNEKTFITNYIDSLNRSNDFEMACLIVSGLESYSIEEYCNKLMKEWKIGFKKKSQGVFILILPKTITQKGQIYIYTNQLDYEVPDVLIQSVINNEFIPNFKNSNYCKGIKDGAVAINNILKNASAYKQVSISKKSECVFRNNFIFIGVAILIVILLIFTLGMLNRLGTHSNSLIIGAIFITVGFISLVLRYDILKIILRNAELILFKLANGEFVSILDYLILISIILIITGLILVIKSLLLLLKKE